MKIEYERNGLVILAGSNKVYAYTARNEIFGVITVFSVSNEERQYIIKNGLSRLRMNKDTKIVCEGNVGGNNRKPPTPERIVDLGREIEEKQKEQE